MPEYIYSKVKGNPFVFYILFPRTQTFLKVLLGRISLGLLEISEVFIFILTFSFRMSLVPDQYQWIIFLS